MRAATNGCRRLAMREFDMRLSMIVYERLVGLTALERLLDAAGGILEWEEGLQTARWPNLSAINQQSLILLEFQAAFRRGERLALVALDGIGCKLTTEFGLVKTGGFSGSVENTHPNRPD